MSRLAKAMFSSSVVGLALCCVLEGVAWGQLGPAFRPSDAAYQSITPCRIADTRIAGGAIPAGGTRDFRVVGTNFTSQGGNACSGAPAGATGAVINLTVVTPGGPGDLRVAPYPTAPTSSILNYGVVAGLSAIANAAVLPLCDRSTNSCPADIRVTAAVSATHFVADIAGYFGKPGSSIAACGSSAFSCTLGSIADSTGPCSIAATTGTCASEVTGGQCRVCAGPIRPGRTYAACSPSAACPSGTQVVSLSAPCTVSSDAGSCQASTGSCVVCRAPAPPAGTFGFCGNSPSCPGAQVFSVSAPCLIETDGGECGAQVGSCLICNAPQGIGTILGACSAGVPNCSHGVAGSANATCTVVAGRGSCLRLAGTCRACNE